MLINEQKNKLIPLYNKIMKFGGKCLLVWWFLIVRGRLTSILRFLKDSQKRWLLGHGSLEYLGELTVPLSCVKNQLIVLATYQIISVFLLSCGVMLWFLTALVRPAFINIDTNQPIISHLGHRPYGMLRFLTLMIFEHITSVISSDKETDVTRKAF